MGRTSGGYTIVEVMIVLAISGVLLFSALTLIQGQQQRTSFSQAMQDVLSSMQNYTSQIQAGSYPSSEGYNCTVSGSANGRPRLTSGQGDDSCVFYGRAFLANPDSDIISSIVILGVRTDASGQSITNINNALPEPADTNGSPAPPYTLQDDYTLGGGAQIVASKGTPSGGSPSEMDLAGIYSQPEGGLDSGSGNPALSLLGYNYSSQAYPPTQVLTNCLEEQSGAPNCSSPQDLSQWSVCMSDGSQQAALEVSANPSGLTYKMNFSPSAAECS